jgi:putative SOS response-associated peptidase YedK
MCSNYLPVTRADRLMTFFGVEYAKEELLQREVFPLGMAPFIRLTVEGQESGKPALVAEDGMFGLLPHFAAERQYGRRTYNARSETVHKLPSFKPAWEASQRCIIPTEAVFEPNYESGSACAGASIKRVTSRSASPACTAAGKTRQVGRRCSRLRC